MIILAIDDENEMISAASPTLAAKETAANDGGLSRHLLIASLLASLALLVLLHQNLFTGRVFDGGDISEFNLPLRMFYQDALHSGDSVLWNPRMFCGYYQQGDGQIGFFHPEHYLMYRFLPLLLAFNLESFLMYIAFWAGVFLLLRRLGFPDYAASVGALTTAFCGFNMLHYGHINAIEVLAHTPWLLLAIHYLCTSSERSRIVSATVGIALLKASQILMGYPFYFFVSAIIEIAFGGWLLWRMGKDRGGLFSRPILRRACLYALALIVGVLIGGVQLQPTRDLARHSSRKQTDFWFRMTFSSHPANLLSCWSPYVLIGEIKNTTFVGAKNEDNPYNGMLSLFCLTWCLARWRRLVNHRPLLAAAVVFGLLGVILSLGYYGFLWRYLGLLPLVSSFRCSGRFIILSQLASMAFAACAFVDLVAIAQGRRPNLDRRETMILGIPLFLSLLSAVPSLLLTLPYLPASLQLHLRLNFSDVSHAFVGVALTLFTYLLFLALAHLPRARILALYVLMAFAAADLGYHWATLYQLPIKTETLSAFIGKMPPIPPHPDGRILTNEYRLNPLMLPGTRMGNGYAGLFPEKTLPLELGEYGPFDPQNETVSLRLASVQWTRPKLPDGKPDVTRFAPVPDPMPRARLVPSVVVSDNIPRAVRFFDVRRVVLIDSETAHSTPELQEEKLMTPDDATPLNGEARIVRERNAEKEVIVRASAPCWLVLSESYHTGWTATSEGKSYPVYRAYGDYLMCRVEPGEHTYQFRFAPRSFDSGRKITLIGLVAVVLLGVAVRYLLPARLWKENP